MEACKLFVLFGFPKKVEPLAVIMDKLKQPLPDGV